MTFEKFQKEAYPRIPPQEGMELFIPAFGLVEEAGEVAGKIKKAYRDNNGVIDRKTKHAIKKELADVLFYTRMTAEALGYTLEDIANQCIYKLKDREKRGVLHGSGDNR